MNEQARQFLQLLRPQGGLVTLPIMRHGRAPIAMTFELPGEMGEALAWLELQARHGCNIYYQHQIPNDRHLNKLAKTDIAEIWFLHADIDWKVGKLRLKATPEMKAGKVAELHALSVAPSIIVDSGNGIQALWRLESPASIELAERANKALCSLLNADDGTWNGDRMLRLPGFINLPSEEKRNYGIEDAPTLIIEADTACRISYSIEAFPLADAEEVRRALVAVTATASSMTEEDLEALKLPGPLAEIIRNGQHAEYSPRDVSNSGWLMYCTCWLVGCGVPDEQILGILLNPLWSISESVLDCRGYTPENYAKRQLERAKEFLAAERALTKEEFAAIKTSELFGDELTIEDLFGDADD
jgi:hypothetical protein